MTITYPIIETQLRLIRALQRGYAEALEAGDWQAADYRCAHLHKLCEGLYHLSQLLDKGNSNSATVTPKNSNGWVSSIRSATPVHSLTQSPVEADKPAVSSPLPPEPTRYEWGGDSLQPPGIKPPPIDEVWK